MSQLPTGPSLGSPSPPAPASPAASPTQPGSAPFLGRHVSFPAIHDVLTRHGHGVLAEHPHGIADPNPVYDALHEEAARLWPEHLKQHPEQAGEEHFKQLAATVTAEHFPRHAMTPTVLRRFRNGPNGENAGMVEGVRAQIGDYALGGFPALQEHLNRHLEEDRQAELEGTGQGLERWEHDQARTAHPAVARILDEGARQPTDEGYARHVALAGEYLQEQGMWEQGEQLLARAYKIAPQLLKFARQDQPILFGLLESMGFSNLSPAPATKAQALAGPLADLRGFLRQPAAAPAASGTPSGPFASILKELQRRQVPAGTTLASWKKQSPAIRHPGAPASPGPTQRTLADVPPRRFPREAAVSALPSMLAGGPRGSRQERIPLSQMRPLGEREKIPLSVAGRYAQQAKQAGLNPTHLHQAAQALRTQHEQFRGEVATALSRARAYSKAMGWGDLRTLAARNSKGKLDYSQLKGFDQLAEEFGERYPDLVKGGNPDETLFNLMVSGAPPALSHEESYEQALRYLQSERELQDFRLARAQQRQPGEDEPEGRHRAVGPGTHGGEIPFARRSVLLFARTDYDTVDEGLWQECQRICPPARPAQLPAQLGCIDGNDFCLVDGDKHKIEDDMDFVEGNNSQEAPWVRKRFGPDYVIVDANIAPHDWPPVLYHECHEVRLMKAGMSYEEAHRHANACERQLRIRQRRERGSQLLAA